MSDCIASFYSTFLSNRPEADIGNKNMWISSLNIWYMSSSINLKAALTKEKCSWNKCLKKRENKWKIKIAWWLYVWNHYLRVHSLHEKDKLYDVWRYKNHFLCWWNTAKCSNLWVKHGITTCTVPRYIQDCSKWWQPGKEIYRRASRSPEIQNAAVLIARYSVYSDISNNRTGTAIYFQKIILPLRSY